MDEEIGKQDNESFSPDGLLGIPEDLYPPLHPHEIARSQKKASSLADANRT